MAPVLFPRGAPPLPPAREEVRRTTMKGGRTMQGGRVGGRTMKGGRTVKEGGQ